MDNTVKAFAVSATTPTGYGALGAPTGRYIAPANSPTCIESSVGYGDCGLRTLTVNGPGLMRFDLGISKKFRLWGSATFDFRAEMLNALNTPYFNPASTAGIPLGINTTFSAPGGPINGNGTADVERDRRHERRQLPSDGVARRQHRPHRPAGLARSVLKDGPHTRKGPLLSGRPFCFSFRLSVLAPAIACYS